MERVFDPYLIPGTNVLRLNNGRAAAGDGWAAAAPRPNDGGKWRKPAKNGG